MKETLDLLDFILQYSIKVFLVCAVVGFFISVFSKEYVVLKRYFSLLSPTYYLFCSVALFCFIVKVFLAKYFDMTILLFFAALLIILIGGIKAYKLSKNGANFEKFKRFLLKKYICDLLIMTIFMVVVYAFYLS